MKKKKIHKRENGIPFFPFKKNLLVFTNGFELVLIRLALWAQVGPLQSLEGTPRDNAKKPINSRYMNLVEDSSFRCFCSRKRSKRQTGRRRRRWRTEEEKNRKCAGKTESSVHRYVKYHSPITVNYMQLFLFINSSKISTCRLFRAGV